MVGRFLWKIGRLGLERNTFTVSSAFFCPLWNCEVYALLVAEPHHPCARVAPQSIDQVSVSDQGDRPEAGIPERGEFGLTQDVVRSHVW